MRLDSVTIDYGIILGRNRQTQDGMEFGRALELSNLGASPSIIQG